MVMIVMMMIMIMMMSDVVTAVVDDIHDGDYDDDDDGDNANHDERMVIFSIIAEQAVTAIPKTIFNPGFIIQCSSIFIIQC